MGKRSTFSKEFKLEAVRLLEAGNKPASEIALDLGIRRNQLYKWRDQLRELGEVAFTRPVGRPPKASEDEVTRLRRELEQVKQERDILKKAAAYFAKELP